MADAYKPNQKMAAAAKKGLELREKFNRGGTEIGVKRAKQLAAQETLDEADVKSMHSSFARHEVDHDTKSHRWGDDADPSAGYIAWLLWGGDEGKKWADAKQKSLDK